MPVSRLVRSESCAVTWRVQTQQAPESTLTATGTNGALPEPPSRSTMPAPVTARPQNSSAPSLLLGMPKRPKQSMTRLVTACPSRLRARIAVTLMRPTAMVLKSVVK